MVQFINANTLLIFLFLLYHCTLLVRYLHISMKIFVCRKENKEFLIPIILIFTPDDGTEIETL